MSYQEDDEKEAAEIRRRDKQIKMIQRRAAAKNHKKYQRRAMGNFFRTLLALGAYIASILVLYLNYSVQLFSWEMVPLLALGLGVSLLARTSKPGPLYLGEENYGSPAYNFWRGVEMFFIVLNLLWAGVLFIFFILTPSP